MRYLKLSLLFFFSILVVSQVKVQTAFANPQDFSVTPKVPENQRADTSSYFDLTVTPGQEQVLEVTVKNLTNKEQKYRVMTNTAATNDNGALDYSMANFEKDPSMKISIQDYLSLKEKEFAIPANGEKNISIELKLPNEPFEGILLGGVTVIPVVEEKKTSDSGISNIFTRTLAIRLAQNDQAIEPKLESGDVKLSQVNRRNVVKLKIRNTTPVLISSVDADISISKKGNKEPFLTTKKQQLSFAPNSQFYLTTEWNDKLSPGKYIYEVTFKDNKGHEWHFSKEFSVEKEEAKTLNDTSFDEKKFKLEDYYVYILLFILLIIIIVYLIVRRNKEKSAQQQKEQKQLEPSAQSEQEQLESPTEQQSEQEQLESPTEQQPEQEQLEPSTEQQDNQEQSEEQNQ